ncbi:MAG TPA: HAD hydrolase-like protein [Candidatus Nanoarchaeia archaeon]|nr:HAD hydrolase-like protein [Candidatus Nanoarchaeia archaeon]
MKLFVWDLHGVLEHGTDLATIDVTNAVLAKFNYSERLSPEQAHGLYGSHWYKYFQVILPNECHERHVELQAACFETSNNHFEMTLKYLRPNKHVDEVLGAIAKSKHEQIIISNTSPGSLPMFIEGLKIGSYFNEKNVFAVNTHARNVLRTKSDVLKEYINGKNFDKIIVVGDSADDMAMKDVASNIVTYLYAHPEIKIKELNSDYRIRDLRELLKEI